MILSQLLNGWFGYPCYHLLYHFNNDDIITHGSGNGHILSISIHVSNAAVELEWLLAHPTQAVHEVPFSDHISTNNFLSTPGINSPRPGWENGSCPAMKYSLSHLMHLLDETFSKTDRHMWWRKNGLIPVAKPMSSSWGGIENVMLFTSTFGECVEQLSHRSRMCLC